MHKTISGVEVKDADQGTVTAVFSTFNVIDKDGDVTRPGAIKDGTPVVISAYGHESWLGQLPLGKGVIRTTDTEAILDGQFFLDTTHGRDAFLTVKNLGELQEWSYSLQNVKSTKIQFDGQSANELLSIDVKEVSPVLVGAGVMTRTLDIKGGDHPFIEHAAAVLAAVDELTNRTRDVVAMRAEKNRTIGAASGELIERVCSALDRLKASLTDPTDQPTDDDVRDALALLALSQGVTPS